jgi:predicted transcriptional regulator
MSGELESEGSSKTAPSSGSSARRTEASMKLDILRVVANGADRPTQIMYRANMTWITLQSFLRSLVSNGLLAEEKLGTRRRYELTMKGADLIAVHRREKASIEDRLDSLEETIEVLTDPSTLKGIKEGLADLKAGRFKRYDSAFDYKKSLK